MTFIEDFFVNMNIEFISYAGDTNLFVCVRKVLIKNNN